MKIAEKLHKELIARKKFLAIAESCTGGMLAARLTQMPGASLYLLGSIVAYSNGWKEQYLNVSPQTLARCGAVSEETVVEMMMSLFNATEADVAAAISGVAGPSGGTPEKPVGTVFIAVGCRDEEIEVLELQIAGSRQEVIDGAVNAALEALYQVVTS